MELRIYSKRDFNALLEIAKEEWCFVKLEYKNFKPRFNVYSIHSAWGDERSIKAVYFSFLEYKKNPPKWIN